MSEKTGISWTDHTFNPWWGCAKVSPACDNCYAERDSKRFSGDKVLWGADAERRTFDDKPDGSNKHWDEPLKWARQRFNECGACGARGNLERAVGYARVCKSCGADALRPARARVFCASMADVFDKNAPDGARDRLWRLIAETPSLDWLLLTKRIGNVHRMVPPEWVAAPPGREIPRWPDNAWLGITVVNQDEADRDIPKLLEIPAAVRFLSIEPMLGPIDLQTQYYTNEDDWVVPVLHDLSWVIAGGESGPQARPMHPTWPRQLRDQCANAGVPFHFKQWGEWAPNWLNDDAGNKIAGSEWVDRMGKKIAGRLLDGIEHNGFPRGAA